MNDIELYNWVMQVYCETSDKARKKPIRINGKVHMDPAYKPVPTDKRNNVLLDLNRT